MTVSLVSASMVEAKELQSDVGRGNRRVGGTPSTADVHPETAQPVDPDEFIAVSNRAPELVAARLLDDVEVASGIERIVQCFSMGEQLDAKTPTHGFDSHVRPVDSTERTLIGPGASLGSSRSGLHQDLVLNVGMLREPHRLIERLGRGNPHSLDLERKRSREVRQRTEAIFGGSEAG